MPPTIIMSDWSKLSGSFFSQASYALIEAKQQVNQAASQKDIDLRNVDWSKVWADILSALRQAGRLLANVWGTILSSVLSTLTNVNDWSIIHPYAAAGALIFISASTNLGIFLTLLQLTGIIAVFLCLLPVRLIVWCFGLRSQGVAQGSLASQYQSSHYGSTVPRGSGFAHLQSFGATMWTVPLTLISLLSYAGVAIILGREWGWWLQATGIVLY
ncbi:hypothetical protein EV702DRAFT_792375 [Suillus placidus]|uniref:Uncharacterized protein n=1 Tax=Suillus placidus TaxID=48579 RepID=A0A9P6ZIA6_9AGAM|nr:hypothetical protein EV702DRAFT_109087 [Suillus placidus]KAG1766356.1 hypothetical protein EV702DRAFT_792375 [Suillus placidus]